MSKIYKKLSIIFVMVLAIMVGSFSNVMAADDAEIGSANLNNTAENSARVGQQLVHPEKGWKRYDDTNSNITYLGDGWVTNTDKQPNFYNSSARYSKNIDNSLRFNFTGSKIRIITCNDFNSSKDIELNIDGNKENFNVYYSGSLAQVISYENKNLSNKEHSVIITLKENKFLEVDAIDIDEKGELKPYNEMPVLQGFVLNIEPEKNKIKATETVSANLIIDNIKDIAAEDVRIKYDNTKLQFLGAEEVDGIKLVKNDAQPGELRFIVASKGEKNIANAKKALLKLNFKGIAVGEALVDVTKGRVSDGIEMEKDLTDEQCGQATITIEELKDVNNSGEFTLLDLAIDARHMDKDPKSSELTKYNTDIVENNAIDEADLLQIGKLMLENPNYKF